MHDQSKRTDIKQPTVHTEVTGIIRPPENKNSLKIRKVVYESGSMHPLTIGERKSVCLIFFI